jgi:CubicO group peptidase (beta-lactamase class C family)
MQLGQDGQVVVTKSSVNTQRSAVNAGSEQASSTTGKMITPQIFTLFGIFSSSKS